MQCNAKKGKLIYDFIGCFGNSLKNTEAEAEAEAVVGRDWNWKWYIHCPDG